MQAIKVGCLNSCYIEVIDWCIRLLRACFTNTAMQRILMQNKRFQLKVEAAIQDGSNGGERKRKDRVIKGREKG
jgi:hypothetical protein